MSPELGLALFFLAAVETEHIFYREGSKLAIEALYAGQKLGRENISINFGATGTFHYAIDALDANNAKPVDDLARFKAAIPSLIEPYRSELKKLLPLLELYYQEQFVAGL